MERKKSNKKRKQIISQMMALKKCQKKMDWILLRLKRFQKMKI